MRPFIDPEVTKDAKWWREKIKESHGWMADTILLELTGCRCPPYCASCDYYHWPHNTHLQPVQPVQPVKIRTVESYDITITLRV